MTFNSLFVDLTRIFIVLYGCYLFERSSEVNIWELLTTFDILLGIALTAISLCAVVFLTMWSRRIIERIHARPQSSLREIQKEIINGNKS